MKILERSVPTRKELPIVEKQLKLVEEEFIREMRADYPEVKMLISNTMIILEGPDKDVQSGATKLDELMKKVMVKKLKLSTDLVTFIKSTDVVSKYQTRFQQSLRNPVALEVGSDLVLSSLSSGALDEAEAAVLRDLSVSTVQLHGAAAVSPDLDTLKEILIKAKNKANSREVRVDVSFMPGISGTTMTKVRIVGYSDNVNKLKEVLQDYQINQVETQEVLNMSPELVDCFDKILDLIGMKQTKVTLKASQFPYPCVLISGPRFLVQKTRAELNKAITSLTTDTLVLDGPGAQRYFQAEGKTNKEFVESSCQVIIKEQQTVKTKQRSMSSPSPISRTPRPSTSRGRCNTVGSMVVNNTKLEIKVGSLEDEQANVLVVPMLNKQLSSTKIGSCLLSKAGGLITSKFDREAAKCILAPGDVLQVDGPPSLGCSKIYFIECLPWDGARGQSVQALDNGMKRCLDLCVQQGWCSVAFPVIGPGVVLKYPLREAIQVLSDKIRQFGLSASSRSLTSIHVVIKPGYPDSEECYHEAYRHLSLNMNHGDQVIFRSLTSDLDVITITIGGGVKLQVVFGDITNETTDGIVNTTDFINFNDVGVCKDILTVAGPEVEAELKGAKVNRGQIFVSLAGSFPCKAILHVCGEKDAGIIEKLMCDIIQHCEVFDLQSVAIPAICAGAGGMDPGVVAGAIIRGLKTATSTPLHCLTDIRLVLIKIDVFLAFKEEAMQVFSTAAKIRVSELHLPYVQHQPLHANTDLSILHTSSTNLQSVFLFLGSRNNVATAMTKLKDLYQTQCSTQAFTTEQLEGLTQDDITNLKQLVETQGLYMQMDHSGNLIVSGLKDGVNQVTQSINVYIRECLKREMRVREEEDLYTRVVWCLLGANGNWERLPKTANYNLDNGDIAGEIVDAQGLLWTVDLSVMEATRQQSGQTAKLKRLENLPDFTLPLYWDNMAAGEAMKSVVLQSSSPEYRAVKEAFKRTVTKTVMKIERLQNLHLRRAYEALKKQISDKNVLLVGAGEKLLYHGTTQDNCDSIMKTGFNRSFAGQNATACGHGTYFAVNASYSANSRYAKPAADGSQLMFVARVLTGSYTVGQSTMKVPPPHNDQQPHDRYDSLVDKIDNPSMYVVFHDSQAYPDYLITFK
ncbi:protein mono-ADP-ribosyltransferase PARP15-like isoform X2 [Channa argus]